MTDASNSIDYFRVLPENINSYLEKGFIIYQQQCNKCKTIKPLSDFAGDKSKENGHVTSCKECRNNRRREIRSKRGYPVRKKLNLDLSKESYCHKCKKVLKRSEFFKKTTYRCKKCIQKAGEDYRRGKGMQTALNYNINLNEERRCSKCRKVKPVKEYCKGVIDCKSCRAKIIKERKKIDIQFKITSKLRASLSSALKRKNNSKTSSTFNLLGCTIDKFINYMEDLFAPGMTWDNHGLHGWHIDHIKPCAAFDLTRKEEQKQCFHYTNLQPLWAEDNRRKGAQFTD
jgi:hypothetical protein